MQWEYKRVIFQVEHDDRVIRLDELGAEGWELVAVLAAGGSPVAYMKRQKQDAPK